MATKTRYSKHEGGVSMTPSAFLSEVVRPNLDDLDRDFANVRFALNAIHAVDALAARIFVAAGGKAVTGAASDIAYRNHLADRNAEFRLTRDLAKAVKHFELTQGSPSVSNASSVTTQALGYGVARWREGRWGSPPQVTVTTDAGEIRVVQTVLTNAVAFLEAEMVKYGL